MGQNIQRHECLNGFEGCQHYRNAFVGLTLAISRVNRGRASTDAISEALTKLPSFKPYMRKEGFSEKKISEISKRAGQTLISRIDKIAGEIRGLTPDILLSNPYILNRYEARLSSAIDYGR